MEPDQIDMMNEDELRGELRRLTTQWAYLAKDAENATEFVLCHELQSARTRIQTLEAAIREHRDSGMRTFAFNPTKADEKLWSHLPEDDTQ